MNKLQRIVMALFALTLPLAMATKVFAVAGPNLVANPSVETHTVATQPDGWATGGWGTNTTSYTYVTNEGHTGTSSLKTTISAYTNGDAKWYSTPVAVTAGATYTYSDWYKATIASDVVAEFQSTTGTYSYAWMATTPVAAAWAQVSANIVVPAGTAKATVFHLISKAGTLQIDDSYFGTADTTTTPPVVPPVVPPVTPPVVAGNLVPNPSLETADSAGTKPAGWQSQSWGTNTTAFTYATTGQDGTRSGRIDMTARTNGDAKWYFGQQAVTANTNYLFTDYYMSNVATEVDVQVTLSNGTTAWYWLGSVPAASAWTQYKAQFMMPAGAVNASFMQIIAAKGWLQTDNYSLAPYTPTGLNRALVSLTFDDAWRSIYTNGLPELNKFGFKSTQYLLTGVSTDSQYMTVAMMKAFKDGGHEIASHTVTHPHLTTLTATQVQNELVNSKNWLTTNLGVTPVDFATPYGEYNTAVMNQIKGVYASHRGVEDGFNSKSDLDVYDIKVQNITSNTTLAQLQSWIAQAQQTKTWLVLVYHEIGANIGGDVYHTSVAQLDSHLNAIKTSGIAVVTVQQALAEIKTQQ